MEGVISDPGQPSHPKFWYSVWGLPPDDVSERVKKLMRGLQSHYGGPDFEPHVTVVGAISLTEDDALNKFQSAVDGVKAYTAKVDCISTGTFYYQCVFLLLQPSPEVVEASSHCSDHFGYKQSAPYMPHMSLLYADLSDEEKKVAQEKANTMHHNTPGFVQNRHWRQIHEIMGKDRRVQPHFRLDLHHNILPSYAIHLSPSIIQGQLMD